MPEITGRIAALLLGVLFLWAAAAKALRWSTWARALTTYSLGRWRSLVQVTVPGAELVVGILLLAGPARIGAALALSMLAAFCLAVLRARALRGDRLPCGCFGRDERRDYRTMLLRNSLLGGLAAIVLLSETELPLHGVRVPGAGEVLPAILVGLGVLLCAWVAWETVLSSKRGKRS
jgi:methylamine utilization protein MauE